MTEKLRLNKQLRKSCNIKERDQDKQKNELGENRSNLGNRFKKNYERLREIQEDTAYIRTECMRRKKYIEQERGVRN